ncbi:MAG: radical SAM protein [Gammaproteobacteria bacterium]|nr:radical SAM protein [Gammaproteobacteria bacterium]
MGRITDTLPKSLVPVQGRPLIAYIFSNLFDKGFRHFILPLGYRGSQIQEYFEENFLKLDCQFEFNNAGEKATIGERLEAVSTSLKGARNFLLVNGDTLFDFDVKQALEYHQANQSLATLLSVPITSPFGLIVENEEKVVDFSRDQQVETFLPADNSSLRGYINSGISWLNGEIFSILNIGQLDNFERDLYPVLIKQGKLHRQPLKGVWYCVDTPKDLDILNGSYTLTENLDQVVKRVKKELVSRYSYQNRYVQDANKVFEQILNKTIVPHQLEVQPGRIKGKGLCWMQCPYCYGGSSKNTGERLTPERYEKILRQTGEGPHGRINKLVFAGYATDPLHYEHIDDLLAVARENRQIFGFHTKALRVSDRFVDLLTAPSIEKLSYFSVSLDAGNFESYNAVHGMKGTKADLYHKVLDNISKITTARNHNQAPLDVSVTYLVTRLNNTPEEVLQSIRDVREAGADILRFTFPQVPRGTDSTEEGIIPNRQEIERIFKLLQPVIEKENSDRMSIFIKDLDQDFLIDNHRTLPCIARFIFPSIGFDGYLSHCSESAASHFRDMVLGNLQDHDFWDLFYDYDTIDFKGYMRGYFEKMKNNDCRCDRKEHVVNTLIKESGFFD